MTETHEQKLDESPLNTQALAAVEQLRKMVSDKPEALASAGLALSIAQTATIALQDAADHMRRMQVLTEVTYAKAISGNAEGDPQALIDAAAKASLAATEVLAKAGDTAQAMLDKLAGAK